VVDEGFLMATYDGSETCSLRSLLDKNGRFDVDTAAFIGAEVARALVSARRLGRCYENLGMDDIFVAPDDTITLRNDSHSAKKSTTQQADIYAVGSILYELTTGCPSESGRNHRPLGGVDWLIDPAFEAVVEQAISDSPRTQFKTTSAFLEALRVVSQPPDVGPSTLKAKSRKQFASVGGGVAVLLVVIAVAMLGRGHSNNQAVAMPAPDLRSYVAIPLTTTDASSVGTPIVGPEIDDGSATPNSPDPSPNEAPVEATPAAAVPVVAPSPEATPTSTPVPAPKPVAPTQSRKSSPAPTAAPTPTDNNSVPAPPTTSAPTTTTAAPKPTTTTTAAGPGRLSQPTGVRSEFMTSTGVIIEWNAVPNATGYVVQLKQGGSNGTQVRYVNTSKPSVNFAGLNARTTYTVLIWPSDAAVPGGPGTNQPHAEFTFTTDQTGAA
jgi:outer membrane biosynthesis protein TonB